MKQLITLITLLSMAIFSGCQTEGNDSSIVMKRSGFFNLKSFLSNQNESLRPGIYTKEASIDEETSTKEVSLSDVRNDIISFESFDINKKSWLDKYTIDSSYNQKGNLVSINYSSNDPKLKTKHLTIFYQNGEVQKIKAINQVQNLVYRSSKEFLYNIGKGFELTTSQKVVFLPYKEANIKVKFPG